MTWGEFQRQYDAEGREKADGYSPGDFDGMSDEERARARSMMLNRALNGDSIDLSGLRYIGDATTAATLEAADDVARRLGWRDDVIRHEVLFELTGEYRYLFDLAGYLDGRDPERQERAAYALTWYVLPAETEPFLVDRIVDGRHEPAILPLLKAWIALHQRAVCDLMCFQRHLDLVRRVSDSSPARRRTLLSDAVAGLSS
ncbi:hypothetical protein [Sphingomonas mucosissima]|uniref:DNA alkylation repair enzyme n=1 Tax=Sphingomonas mucosissima TaxID=370959 RepID=A0A245ZJ79_9SPHN|nr:hypothetical protein [Sphingomonas mucosissima]OWK29803.1 hypothetical protein SPMU_22250 [Sphingomonas mucosissima]